MTDNALLWDYDPRTKVLRRLTTRGRSCHPDPYEDEWYDGGLAYSPRGRQIAYLHYDTCEPQGATELRLMNADGTHNRRVASLAFVDPVLEDNVAFAPDGRRLAVFSNDEGRGEVVNVFDVANGTVVKGSAWPRTEFSSTARIDWSVSGSVAAAFCCPGSGFERIYIAQPNGTGIRSVTSVRRSGRLISSDHSPDWSPTGRSIVFVRQWWNVRCGSEPCLAKDRIWKVSPGNPAVPLRLPTKWTGYVDSPIFSPDGREVAFIGSASAFGTYRGAIFAVPANGKRRAHALLRRRPPILRFETLDWQPLPR